MEDAIALSQAFVRHPGEVERALVDYRSRRGSRRPAFRAEQGPCSGSEMRAFSRRIRREGRLWPSMRW
jgi:hypothetical protein